MSSHLSIKISILGGGDGRRPAGRGPGAEGRPGQRAAAGTPPPSPTCCRGNGAGPAALGQLRGARRGLRGVREELPRGRRGRVGASRGRHRGAGGAWLAARPVTRRVSLDPFCSGAAGHQRAPTLSRPSMSEFPCKKRDDYLEWPEYFMAVAFLSAQRSKDPNSQVGACIMNAENKIVGTGYNGMPNGCSDDLLPWRRTADSYTGYQIPLRFS